MALFSNEAILLSRMRTGSIWFKKWIIERQGYRYLIRDSGMSESCIQCLFKRFLSQAPAVAIKPKHKTHLLIYGSYFPNGLCLILYYDHDIRYVQLYRHTDEDQFKKIYEGLMNIRALGVEVYNITYYGHKAILKATCELYQLIPNKFIIMTLNVR